MESIENILHGIYNDNKKIVSSNNNRVGLMSGKMGIVLFLYHYADFFQKPEASNLGENFLNSIILDINEGDNIPTFCDGIYGVGWGFNYLISHNFLQLRDELLFKKLDDTIPQGLELHFHNKYFDFLHGYIGLGLYILKRYEITESCKLYSDYLFEIINQLRNKVSEFRNYNDSCKNRNYLEKPNLGLAHGVAGIVNFLSRLTVIPRFSPKAKPVLLMAIDFLLENKNPKGFISIFPTKVQVRTLRENANSRLAWCQGDLGIGLSIWHASNSLNNENLREEALNILIHSAKRLEPKKNYVIDACLCHGTMGIMLIFDYLFKKTKILDFKNASDFWLNEGINMGNRKNEVIEFKSALFWENEWTYKKEIDLLDGSVGIGLALISFLSKKSLKWSQCLMIAS